MLDLRLFRDDPDRVRAAMARRGSDIDIDRVIELDAERRRIVTEVEALKQERNLASKQIGQRKQAGEDIEPAKEAVRRLGEEIAGMDRAGGEIEERLRDLLLRVPNLPHPDTPEGLDESANVVLRTEGTAREFDFDPKPHWEVGEALAMFDFPRAARMSGSGFALLKGQGAKLSRALIQFMLDLHTREHGYTEVLPPLLCNSRAMTGTGQLPKFHDDQYGVREEDLWLIPTAEVPLTNLYGDEILDQELPVALTGHTPCFRREAGAAGKLTRGLNRLHQFEKVELVRLVEPARSDEELALLTSHAETVLRRLGLHYRVLSLCAGDLSASSTRTIDLELWAPGQEMWLEVSSCSNFGDYQARRAGIKYRDADGKARFVHTLNGSGVALPRLLVAILENGQRADGSVVVPEVLHPYMGGVTELTPA